MALGAKQKDEEGGWRGRWLRKTPRKQTFLSAVLGDNPVSDTGNPYASYLSRSVLLEEASPPRNVRATINIIVGAVAAFVVWASVTKLDERAVAPGEISPVSFVYPIQHFEGGIVGETLVENGDFVNEGDPVMLLDQTAPRAEYQSLMARNVALKLQVERLRAFALGRPARFEEVPPGFQHFVDDQREILAAQISAREAQIAVINAQISEAREQIQGLQEQEETLVEEVRLVQEEVDIHRQLIDRGLTRKITYLSAQRDLAQARGNLADVRSRITRAEASIRELSGRILEIEERLRNEAFTQMGAVSSEQAQVQSQVGRLEDRLARTSITAPITGRVASLLERSPGGVIGPGEILMEIVPTEQELIAEIRISPRDIGHVEEGLEVLVKVETYNYARYGGIKGKLQNISAASYADEEGNTFFTAEVVLERNYVGMDPRSNQIRPSMTLIADIKTGEKTLMAYLMRPVYNTLQDSFGER